MSTLTRDLADLLKNVRRPGDFFTTGRAEIVARCRSGLGVGESVSAELYTLLVYDTGSFFNSPQPPMV